MAFIVLDDSLLRFAKFSDFPLEGETGFVYLDESRFKAYLWDTTDDSYNYFAAFDPNAITSADQATETERGIAEIATQAETDTGTDDERFVTPLKLANWSGGGGGLVDLLDGSGLLPIIPNGIWSVVNLGPGLENKIVYIHAVSTVNPQRTVGARSVGGGLELSSLQARNSISFLIKTNGSSEIELFRSGGGVLFYHRKTLVN